MTEVWAAVAIVGAVTIAIKATGALALHERTLPPRTGGMIELLAPVMLAALVVTNTFGGDHKLELDARAVGLGVAVVPIALRAPLLVTIVVAAGAAALVRAL